MSKLVTHNKAKPAEKKSSVFGSLLLVLFSKDAYE